MPRLGCPHRRSCSLYSPSQAERSRSELGNGPAFLRNAWALRAVAELWHCCSVRHHLIPRTGTAGRSNAP
jgi:hypothetical protein